MQGYDSNGMCYECGGKAGEHGPGCDYGWELTKEYVTIVLEKEQRRQKSEEVKNDSFE
jgi:hypothetical protein